MFLCAFSLSPPSISSPSPPPFSSLCLHSLFSVSTLCSLYPFSALCPTSLFLCICLGCFIFPYVFSRKRSGLFSDCSPSVSPAIKNYVLCLLVILLVFCGCCFLHKMYVMLSTVFHILQRIICCAYWVFCLFYVCPMVRKSCLLHPKGYLFVSLDVAMDC